MPLTIRRATGADAAAIARIDTRYTAGERILAFERAGAGAEIALSLRWRAGTPYETVYGDYPDVRGALAKTDLFLVAEDGGRTIGLLMVVVPSWTDAGEITDLAVDRAARRRGVARGLVASAVEWAQGRGLRALWVEPRADNADAIDFYLSLGFRLSGYNDRMYANDDDADGRPTLFMYLEVP
jgi:streptothricin acetyltransferase